MLKLDIQELFRGKFGGCRYLSEFFFFVTSPNRPGMVKFSLFSTCGGLSGRGGRRRENPFEMGLFQCLPVKLFLLLSLPHISDTFFYRGKRKEKEKTERKKKLFPFRRTREKENSRRGKTRPKIPFFPIGFFLHRQKMACVCASERETDQYFCF